MDHRSTKPGHLARAKRTLLLTAVLALLDAAPSPQCALAGQGLDLTTMLPEFNHICADLARAREELRLGALDEESFAARVLDLFVRADSLNVLVQASSPASRRSGGTLFAMERGLRYLIESLRENYMGIVARNGVSFVAADRALQAAVAWRSGVPTGGGTKSVADAARP